MKKWWIGILTVGILFIAGIVIGYTMYSLQNTKQTPMDETRLAEENGGKTENEVQNEMVPVVAQAKKIQPNTTVIVKEYYTKCDHLLQEEQVAKDILVNMTEEELQAYYKDYKIEEFSEPEVILYKECKEWCPKHYILKNEDGVIVIYRLNAQGKETLLETTDILVAYLPPEDQQRLTEGIALIGDELLNSTLEDFE